MSIFFDVKYSQFSRSNTDRGSSTCPVTVDPTKVEACNSILFTKDPSVDKRQNTCSSMSLLFFYLAPLLNSALVTSYVKTLIVLKLCVCQWRISQTILLQYKQNIKLSMWKMSFKSWGLVPCTWKLGNWKVTVLYYVGEKHVCWKLEKKSKLSSWLC